MNLKEEKKKALDDFDEKFEEALADLLAEEVGLTKEDIVAYFGPTYLGVYLMKRLEGEM